MPQTPETPPLSDDEALACEYALGTLPLEERQAIEARLLDDPQLRALVAKWDAHLLPLSEAFEPEQPPAATFDAIQARLFEPLSAQSSAAPASGAPTSDRPTSPASWLESLALWRGLAGIGIAAALVLGVIIYQQPGTDPSGGQIAFVTQLRNEDASLSIAAFYDQQAQQLILTRQAGRAAPGRDFELWFILPDIAPISLGTLPEGDRIELALSDDLAAQIDDTVILAISDEPTGGSPTGQATGDVLAIGQIEELQI